MRISQDLRATNHPALRLRTGRVHMGLWKKSVWNKAKKRQILGSPRRGISVAALEGASTEELCQEAFLTIERRLRHQSHAVERFAVWLSPSGDFKECSIRYAFVLPRSGSEGGDTGAIEWDLFGPEWSVPPEIFAGNPSVDQQLVFDPNTLASGGVTELRRSLWMPVRYAGELIGVMLVASRNPSARFPLDELRRLAAELALALGSRTELERSRSRAQELAEAQKILAGLNAGAAAGQLLQQLAEGALRSVDRIDVPHFVMIGFPARTPVSVSGHSSSSGHSSFEFHFVAGDKILARAAMAEPASAVWRKAMDSRTVTGECLQEHPKPNVRSRIVAIPLLHASESIGILVAGLPAGSASLATLARLELRARLASTILLTPASERRAETDFDASKEFQFAGKFEKLERLAALGQKVSGVAHELSNPLTTILGYAQRLLRKSAASEYRDDLLRIFSEADRAASILRQLLGSVRDVPAGRRAIDLNQLIRETVEIQRQFVNSERIRLELEFSANLPPLAVDGGQLQQILTNLLSNSRHALSEQPGGGTIFVRTRLDRSARIVLEVADTGPGIPDAIRDRIFDPFVTTKPAGVGTGLGLSIVKSLVMQNEGEIAVHSGSGRGATFTITFPRAETALPIHSPILPPALSTLPATPATRGVQVLVIEDEITVAQLIADMLSDLGYSPDVHNDSRRALVSALNRNYALIICDMKMPGLDGQHLYRALAEAGSPLISRFLFVTGDVLALTTQEFLRVHRLPHIAKPFRLEEFSEKVAVALRQADAAPAPLAARGTTTHNLGSHKMGHSSG